MFKKSYAFEVIDTQSNKITASGIIRVWVWQSPIDAKEFVKERIATSTNIVVNFRNIK